MLYDFRCQKCEHIQEDTCLVDERLTHFPKCEKCGDICKYKFTPTVIQFALKDGPSGIAPSKALRFKDHRRKASEAASKRQRDRYGEAKQVIPNVSGNELSSWREAESVALKEFGPASAATYKKRANKERLA